MRVGNVESAVGKPFFRSRAPGNAKAIICGNETSPNMCRRLPRAARLRPRLAR